jgi:hypothetical protein
MAHITLFHIAISAAYLEKQGGFNAFGEKVSNLNLDLPKGILEAGLYSQEPKSIGVQYDADFTNEATITQWLKDKEILSIWE